MIILIYGQNFEYEFHNIPFSPRWSFENLHLVCRIQIEPSEGIHHWHPKVYGEYFELLVSLNKSITLDFPNCGLKGKYVNHGESKYNFRVSCIVYIYIHSIMIYIYIYISMFDEVCYSSEWTSGGSKTLSAFWANFSATYKSRSWSWWSSNCLRTAKTWKTHLFETMS